jgi:hypothetical protein
MRKRILLLLLVTLALSFAMPSGVQAGTPTTWEGTIDGVPAWITVVPRGHDVSAQAREHEPWWQWGNTTTDAYLFAFERPDNVRLILSFTRQPDGLPEAAIYANNEGDTPLQYTLDGDALTVQSNGGHPYLRMLPQGGGWLVQGKTNYRLTLLADGVVRGIGYPDARTDGTVDTVIQVGSQQPGIPEWMTMRVVSDPDPKAQIFRFVAVRRLKDAPPFKVAPPLMPTFPYLGMKREYLNSSWFVENPDPLFFDLAKSEFMILPFPAFQNAGTYAVNSLSLPPRLDFESPFVFYSFDPTTRYSQLVVRSDSFPAGDPYGVKPQDMPRLSFRYSWKTRGSTLWTYSLQVAGFHEYTRQVPIGNTWAWGVSPDELPMWVTSQPWPLVTFVEAVNGYPGSEGIYFYTAQGATPWPWLSGATDQPPEHLAAPYLPRSDELTEASNYGLPDGFRGEYNDAYFRDPTLYFSPIDNRVHLLHAQGGVWNLGDGVVLREHNLDGGPYVDGWTRERVPPQADVTGLPRALPGTVEQALYALDNYLIYSDSNTAELLHTTYRPATFEVRPPTDKNSWQDFRQLLEPYRNHARDPKDLQEWLTAFPGEALTITNGRISDVRVIPRGFRFEVDLRPGFHLDGKDILGLGKLEARQYVVTYDGQFTIQPLTPPNLSVDIQAPPDRDLRTDRVVPIQIDVTNTGLDDTTHDTLKVVAVYDGKSEELSQQTVDLLSEKPTRIALNWQPRASGQWQIRVRVEDTRGAVLAAKSRTVDVTGGTATTEQGVLLISTSDHWQVPAFLLLLCFAFLISIVARAALHPTSDGSPDAATDE